MTKNQLAKYIEETLLSADATVVDIENLCEKAKKYGFYGICVSPKYVELAKELLKATEIKVISVVGYPYGTTLPEVKSVEAMLLSSNGADELDVVPNYSALKEGELDLFYNEIMDLSHEVKIPVKIVLDAKRLNEKDMITASKLSIQAGAKFIKVTNATAEIVQILSNETMGDIKIKVSAGIKDLNTALSFVSTGATRIGTSSGDKIIDEFKA